MKDVCKENMGEHMQRRFEDEISIEDIMNEKNDVLIAKIYVQVLKINGTVAKHAKDIEHIRENCILQEKSIREKLSTKFSTKGVTILTAALALIIILFNVLELIGVGG